MPTFVGHVVQGLAASTLVPAPLRTGRFWFATFMCAIIPDLDVATFAFGISYAHPLGHRGFFHSFCFAALHGALITWLLFRGQGFSRRQLLGLAGFFAAVTGVHDLFDALTNGGLGIALLAPFDNTRYFLPITPIEVSPIGIRSFLSARGLEVLASEFLWVWGPAAAFAAIVLTIKRLRKARRARAAPPTSGTSGSCPGTPGTP